MTIDQTSPWFTHVVLTRFNVRVSGATRRPDDSWYLERLELFETYAVRTFEQQSVDNFEWFVFLADDTPPFVRSALERIDQRHPGTFQTVYIDDTFGPEAIRTVIADLSTTHLLSTRVDNDDAVSSDFVEQIQRASRPVKREFLNLVDGAQLSSRGIYRRPYTSNPFISLVEEVREGEHAATVFVRGHDEAARFGPIRNIKTGHVMWLQLVHTRNIANEIVGIRMRSSHLGPWFPIVLPKDPARPYLIADQIWSSVKVTLRLLSKPARLRELARVIAARKGPSDDSE